MALGKNFGNSLLKAKAHAIEQSKKNPKLYYTIFNAFGLFVRHSKYLHVFAPSESIGGFYVKNGKVKEFTNAQKINDQNKTPTIR
jgi:hypothetical protein